MLADKPVEPQGIQPEGRWVIVVAKGQQELYLHLCRAFAGDSQVQVVLDRRANDRRNPSQVNERLRTYGAALVRRPKG